MSTLSLPPVAIILVNWNGWRETIECLDSLLAQDYPSFHIYVVDNDSADDSLRHIRAWCEQPRAEREWRSLPGVRRTTDTRRAANDRSALARVTLIASGGNLGFAGGCNVGLAAAGQRLYDWFWILNTDTVVHADALGALVRRAQDTADIGMVGSTLRYYDRPDVVQARGGARLDRITAVPSLLGLGTDIAQTPADPAVVENELDYVMGASLLVSSRFVREIGPMQEDYFLYYEEADWALRSRPRFSLAWAPDSHVFHKAGATSTQQQPLFSTRCYYRSRMRFARRFMPARIGTVRRGLLVEALRHGLRARWGHAQAAASAAFLSGPVV